MLLWVLVCFAYSLLACVVVRVRVLWCWFAVLSSLFKGVVVCGSVGLFAYVFLWVLVCFMHSLLACVVGGLGVVGFG